MAFILNSTTISRLTRLDWQDGPGDNPALSGTTATARWRRLVCAADVLSAAEWNALRAVEGQQCRITAPPYADRNAAWQTYYGAILERLDGRHEGPVVTGVTAEFMVRV